MLRRSKKTLESACSCAAVELVPRVEAGPVRASANSTSAVARPTQVLDRGAHPTRGRSNRPNHRLKTLQCKVHLGQGPASIVLRLSHSSLYQRAELLAGTERC
jgi:hypothetical protein